MANRQLSGKRVLLTGASAGIGWHLAVALAKKGAQLLLTARREEKLAQLVDELQHSSTSHSAAGRSGIHHKMAGDITDGEHRRMLLDWCQTQWGAIDILINNAGVGTLGSFKESKPENLREVMEVNFFAPVELIRASLPLLKNGQQPLIVNVCSVLGHRAVPLKSEYCASKFALHGFSDSLRAEVSEDGIDLTLISPSTTDSEFFDNSLEDRAPRNWKGKRPMSPEAVAAATTKAIEKGSHEVILSLGGRSLVLMDRLAPTLANKAVQRWGK